MAAAGSKTEELPTLKYTYFDFQGSGEQVRLALHLAGVPFEDDRLPSREAWMELKPSTPFGQLPILTINGSRVMAQSRAMLRYIGRLNNSGLYPSDLDKAFEVDQMVGVAADLQEVWYPCIGAISRPERYGHTAEFWKTEEGAARKKAMREHFVATELPRFAGYVTRALEANAVDGVAAFVNGPTPTIADCALLPYLRRFTMGFIDHVATDCLEPFPAVTAWMDRMLALPQIKAYYDALAAAKK